MREALPDKQAQVVWMSARGTDVEAGWPNLASALRSSYCRVLPDAGRLRELTEADMQHIFVRHLRGGGDGGGCAAGNAVSLASFASFWPWWVAILRTLRATLGLWCRDDPVRIHGFVSKPAAEAALRESGLGTFLIRFSDSQLGYLALAWVDAVGPDQRALPGRIVHCLVEPRNSGFVVGFPGGAVLYHSLTELVHHLKKLTTLFPGVHKDAAFALAGKDSEHLLHEPALAGTGGDGEGEQLHPALRK